MNKIKDYRWVVGIVFFLVMVMSGCGGGGGGDDLPNSSATTSIKSIQASWNVDKLTKEFMFETKLVNTVDAKVTLDNFEFELGGCQIDTASLQFNGNSNTSLVFRALGQSQPLIIKGKLTNGDCEPSSKVLTYHETLEKDGKSRTDIHSLVFDIAGPTGVYDYDLTNISTPIIVRIPGELLEISGVVVNKNNIPVAEHNVSITAITDIKYGSIISAASVQSDESGHVSFTYKAPTNIAQVDGDSTTVSLILQEDSYTVYKTIKIEFHAMVDETPRPFIVIPQAVREVTLTSNSQTVEMNIQVFEENSRNPYTKGTVKVKLPSKVLEGVDVGKFGTYEVPVGSDGVALFHYTGPQNLKALIEKGDSESIFEFYHSENPTATGEVKVIYSPSIDEYIPVTYALSTVSSDGNYTMGLNDKGKNFTVTLKDDRGNALEDEQILEMKISTKNFNVGKLIDPNTGSEVTILTFNGSSAINNKTFTISTKEVSGLVPVEITVRFNDANGEEQEISRVMNVTVFSGPPTALSISYIGVYHDKENAKYVETFDVMVTDAYNNPVNTNPYIATGAMVEYAVDGSSSIEQRGAGIPRLWHGFVKDSNGNYLDTLGALEKVGEDKAKFISEVEKTFRYVDLDNDKLVIFGPGYVYEALGKWDIEGVSGNDDVLELVDNYFGSDYANLGFAVGHNNRQDLCSGDAREYIGSMRSPSYRVDNTGHVLIEFEYDYHLTGKDIMVWVNLTGYQADSGKMVRIGEAQKHTLRGMGLKSDEVYTLPGGTTRSCFFAIKHAPAEVKEWYKNGHFGATTTGKCQVLNIIDTSNFYDARSCENSGVAYIELNVTNPGDDECTIGLDGVAVSPEFRSSTTW